MPHQRHPAPRPRAAHPRTACDRSRAVRPRDRPTGPYLHERQPHQPP
ncbi:hypothetical protein NSERUTF1_5316 [Nocardia seriolae]|nr:hypothetical protein NSERUTF1_5316 [Nocardia seriolae]